MTFDYTEIAETADELLAEFGQAVVLSRKAAGSYNPATGAQAVTTTTQTGVGVLLDHESRDIDGTMIQRDDQRLLLSSDLVTTPVVDDLVAVGGTSYTIKSIKVLAPAGLVVMYDCNVRK